MTTHKSLRLLAPTLLLAASCTSGANLLAPKFSGPSAVVAFRGFTTKHPGEATPRPYLAVANRLRDDLTLVDPLDNNVVLSPTLSFPLAVPTPPRPFRLAAAQLEADDDPGRGADLLVVATQSPPTLRLVNTWSERVSADPLPAGDLAALDAAFQGRALLSLTAVSRPGGGAWLFAGLSGGRLVVLEFERGADATLPASRRPVVRSALAPQVKELSTGGRPFDPLDLAVAPDASRLFVATGDPLQDAGGNAVHGVGQLTVVANSAASTWPVVGLDARAPTRLVAAGSFAQRTRASAVIFDSAPALQVFAVLDEEGCGARKPIGCGVVTLLPDTGIAPDPVGELPYRAPIGFAYPPEALAVVMPRKGGDAAGLGVAWLTPPPSPVDLMAVGTGAPLTYVQTALLAVATADGVVHAVDPGRWGLANASQSAAATHRKLVSSVSATVTDAAAVRPALWNDATIAPGETPAVVFSGDDMSEQVRFTPGYLPTENFVVAWHGTLSNQLTSRVGIVQMADDQAAVAIQTNGVAEANLDDPELAVHVNDLVRVQPALGPCSSGSSFLATVTAVRPRDATFPGGALLLSHAGSGVPPTSLAGRSFPDDVACPTPADVVSSASPGPEPAVLTVLASGFVLTGSNLGYLGRPEVDVDFQLQYQPEAGLTGEALAVARKLRRHFYPADAPCGATIPGTEGNAQPTVVTCEDLTVTPRIRPPANPDPLVAGPMLRFRLALGRCPVVGGAAVCARCDAGNPCPAPGDGAALSLNTSSGLTERSWLSSVTRGVPTGIAWLDASAMNPDWSTVFYVAFATNELLGVTPSTGSTASIH